MNPDECYLALEALIRTERDGTMILREVKANYFDGKINKNSFYIFQLCYRKGAGFFPRFSYNRNGERGRPVKVKADGSFASAEFEFYKKLRQKTRQDWPPATGNLHYAAPPRKKAVYLVVSVLPTPGSSGAEPPEDVLPIISLIKNPDALTRKVVQAGFDTTKCHLGTLDRNTLVKAGEILSRIGDIVQAAQEMTDFIHDQQHDTLRDLSNRFYSLVPHAARRCTVLPVVKTEEQIAEKAQLLETLESICYQMQLLKRPDWYKALKCKLNAVPNGSPEWDLVRDYLDGTFVREAQWGGANLKLIGIAKVEREGEKDRFNDAGFDEDPNRMLLWHGSRLPNFVSLLARGLLIGSSAPKTGSFFGKGIYFADMVVKAARYGFSFGFDSEEQNGDQDICLLLCEVALGDQHCVYALDSKTVGPPEGKGSIKAMGGTVPAELKTLDDGVKVPCGSLVQQATNVPLTSNLVYNEYVLFDEKRIKMRYLVHARYC